MMRCKVITGDGRKGMEMEWDARLRCHTRDDCVVKADWARAAVEKGVNVVAPGSLARRWLDGGGLSVYGGNRGLI
jgi:hypothetical protein